MLRFALTPRTAGHGFGVVWAIEQAGVGGELGISVITVKAHRGQVMQKMRANSLADLVKMAARLELSRRNEFPRLRRDDSGPDLSGVPFDTHRVGISETGCPRYTRVMRTLRPMVGGCLRAVNRPAQHMR